MGRPDLETLTGFSVEQTCVGSAAAFLWLWLGARIHLFLWEADTRVGQHKVHC